jgi:hypothetical protein
LGKDFLKKSPCTSTALPTSKRILEYCKRKITACSIFLQTLSHYLIQVERFFVSKRGIDPRIGVS